MRPEDFERELERILKQLLKEATSKENLQELGDNAAALIKKRVRVGYGLKEHGGVKEKLLPLSAKYKKYRKRTQLGSETSSSKSNLTLTGHMLNSIEAEVKGENSIIIGFKDEFAADKAGWVSKLRPFNFLSKAEIAQLRKQLEKKLNSIIEKILN